MAKVIVGPVLGTITENSIRVLIETDVPGTITVYARTEDLEPAGQVEIQTSVEHPVRAGTIEGLDADTVYCIQIEGLSWQGRAKTRGSRREMRIAVASCNNLFKKKSGHAHNKLLNYTKNTDVDLMLHVGDQVYADTVFNHSVEMLRRTPSGQRESLKRGILEQYRSVYRATWTLPATRAVLATHSNLMIWDDHEVADDWGDKNVFADPRSPEHFVARIAWRVYREYQRQLWDDKALEPIPKFGHREYYLQTSGAVATMFLDTRGGRAFRRGSHSRKQVLPYLSDEQWGWIGAQFLPSGPLKNVRVLVLVAPVPLAFMGPKATEMYDRDEDDLRGHWAHTPYRKEQWKMLELLRKWKQGKGNREVLVIGGDVHIGTISTINYRTTRTGKGKPLFSQLTASAIRYKEMGKLKFAGYKIIINSQPRLFDKKNTYLCKLETSVRRNNFGVATLDWRRSGRPVIGLKLVER